MKQESFIMKQQTARDFHIDNIKGVLIFLVVLGHMLCLCHRRENLYLFFSHAGVYLHVGLSGKGLSHKGI